jgi:hypothetical protein
MYFAFQIFFFTFSRKPYKFQCLFQTIVWLLIIFLIHDFLFADFSDRISVKIFSFSLGQFETFFLLDLPKQIPHFSLHSQKNAFKQLQTIKNFKQQKAFPSLHSIRSNLQKKHSFQYLLPFFCYIEQFFDIKSESQTTFIFIYAGTEQSKSSFDF